MLTNFVEAYGKKIMYKTLAFWYLWTAIVGEVIVSDNWKIVDVPYLINPFHASGDFLLLLIAFVNGLDQDQDGQNVGPDLHWNCLTLRWCSWKIFLKKLDCEKNVSRWQQKYEKLPSMQRVNNTAYDNHDIVIKNKCVSANGSEKFR